MKWVLKYKSDVFATFITESFTDELRENLTSLANAKDVDLSNDELYETLSTFVRYIEHNIQLNIKGESDTTRGNASGERSKKEKKSGGARRHHAHHCKNQHTEFNEAQSIQSPTQKLLYQALFSSNDGSSDSNIH